MPRIRDPSSATLAPTAGAHLTPHAAADSNALFPLFPLGQHVMIQSQVDSRVFSPSVQSADDDPVEPARVPRSLAARPAGSRYCQARGCKLVASFGHPDARKPAFCSAHASGGMVDVRHPPCREAGCLIQPMFGYPPSGKTKHKREYCSQHRLEGMVDLAHSRGARRSSGAFGRAEDADVERDYAPPRPKRRRKRSGSTALATSAAAAAGCAAARGHDGGPLSDDNDNRGGRKVDDTSKRTFTRQLDAHPSKKPRGSESWPWQGGEGSSDLARCSAVGTRGASSAASSPPAYVKSARTRIPICNDIVDPNPCSGAPEAAPSATGSGRKGSPPAERARVEGTIGADTAVTTFSGSETSTATTTKVMTTTKKAAAVGARSVATPTLPGSIVSSRGCRTCHRQPCATTACFGYPGGKRSACGAHKSEGMVNLDRYNTKAAVASRNEAGASTSASEQATHRRRPPSVKKQRTSNPAGAPILSPQTPYLEDAGGSRGNTSEKVANNSGHSRKDSWASDAVSRDAGPAADCLAVGAGCLSPRTFGWQEGGVAEVCAEHRVEGMVDLAAVAEAKGVLAGAHASDAAASKSSGGHKTQSAGRIGGGGGSGGNGRRPGQGASSDSRASVSRRRTGGAKIKTSVKSGGDAMPSGNDHTRSTIEKDAKANRFASRGSGGSGGGDGDERGRIARSAVAGRKASLDDAAQMKASVVSGGESSPKGGGGRVSSGVEDADGGGGGGGVAAVSSDGRKRARARARSSRPTKSYAVCGEAGCATSARFGHPVSRKREFCGEHKQPGMVNLDRHSPQATATFKAASEGAPRSATKGRTSTGSLGQRAPSPKETLNSAPRTPGIQSSDVGDGSGHSFAHSKPLPKPPRRRTEAEMSAARALADVASLTGRSSSMGSGSMGSGSMGSGSMGSDSGSGNTGSGGPPATRSPGAYKICRDTACSLHASFGFLGGRRDFCVRHHLPGMVNLVTVGKQARRAETAAAAAAAAATASTTAKVTAADPPSAPTRRKNQQPMARSLHAVPKMVAPADGAAGGGTASGMTRSAVVLSGGASRGNGERGGGGREAPATPMKASGRRVRDSGRGTPNAPGSGKSSTGHPRDDDTLDAGKGDGKTGNGGAKLASSGSAKCASVTRKAKRALVVSPSRPGQERQRMIKKSRSGGDSNHPESGSDYLEEDAGRYRLRCAVCGRLAKLGCSSESCFDCCVKSGVPCEVHLKQAERKQREDSLLANADAGGSTEVARLPKGAFKEDSFHATGETATLWCLKDFVLGKETQAAMEIMGRVEKRAGRHANPRDGAEGSRYQHRRTNAATSTTAGPPVVIDPSAEGTTPHPVKGESAPSDATAACGTIANASSASSHVVGTEETIAGSGDVHASTVAKGGRDDAPDRGRRTLALSSAAADGKRDLVSARAAVVIAKWRRKHDELLRGVMG